MFLPLRLVASYATQLGSPGCWKRFLAIEFIYIYFYILRMQTLERLLENRCATMGRNDG